MGDVDDVGVCLHTLFADLVNDAGQQDALRINLPALLSRKHWRYLLYYMLEPYGFNSQILASLENLMESDRTSSGKRFESLSHDLFVERTELVVINKDENTESKGGKLFRINKDNRTSHHRSMLPCL